MILERPRPLQLRFPWLAVLILVGVAVLLLLTVGLPAVERTQEARVLDVAREMQINATSATPPRDPLLIPRLEGEIRLQKPPLAYWLALVGYWMYGTANIWAGRVPFALVTLATAFVTFLIGRRMFGARAGLIAMAGFLGCNLTARFGPLAETDMPAACFVTLAIFAFWSGMADPRAHMPRARTSFGWAAAWFHAGAASMALAAMAKGPPASFAFVFLIGLAALRRDWRSIGRWFACGAPLTFLLIATPWYAYTINAVGLDTFRHELAVAAVGGGHRGLPTKYIGDFITGTAPFTIFCCLALVACGRHLWRTPGDRALLHRRRDARLVGLVVWLLAIVVPLCLIGQKQRHYLVPAVPPMMLLTGWYLDRVLRHASRSKEHAALRIGLLATAVLSLLAAIALPFVGQQMRGGLRAIDGLTTGVMLLLATAIAIPLLVRRSTIGAVFGLAAAAPFVLFAIELIWSPTLNATTAASIAQDVRRSSGGRPIVFLLPSDLCLRFHMHLLEAAQPGTTDQAIQGAAGPATQPIYIQTTRVRTPDPLPPGMASRAEYVDGSDLFRVCEVADAAQSANIVIGNPSGASEAASP